MRSSPEAKLSPEEELCLLAIAKADPKSSEGRDATAKVYAHHRGLIVDLCQFMLMDGYDLDDAIQEAYFALAEAIRYYNPDKLNPRTGKRFHFNTYLADCVRRRLATWRKRSRNRPLPQEGRDQNMDLMSRVEAVDMAWLNEELARLQPHERTVLELRYGLGGRGPLAVSHICGRLGLGMKSVEALIAQAKKKLAGILS